MVVSNAGIYWMILGTDMRFMPPVSDPIYGSAALSMNGKTLLRSGVSDADDIFTDQISLPFVVSVHSLVYPDNKIAIGYAVVVPETWL